MCLVLALLRPPAHVTAPTIPGPPESIHGTMTPGMVRHEPRLKARNQNLPSSASPPPFEGGISIGGGLAMLFGFGTFMLLVAAALERLSPSVLLGEWGLLETLQIALLGGSIWLLLNAATKEGRGSALRPLAHLLLIALVRELDGPLDVIWHGFWKVPALVLLVFCARHVARAPRAILQSLERHGKAPHAGLFLAAAAVVLLQSRLLGKQSLWRSIMGDDFVYVVPRIVEEASELAGYGLVFLAAVQVHRLGRSLANRTVDLVPGRPTAS